MPYFNCLTYLELTKRWNPAFFGTLLILFTVSIQATANTMEDVDPACFKKVAILGASMSSGYSGLPDAIMGKGMSHQGNFNDGSRPGPIYKFLTDNNLNFEDKQQMNFADLTEWGSATEQYFFATGVWNSDHYSDEQLSDLKDRLDNGSAIFAVDGFYWDAIGANSYQHSCGNAMEAVTRLTQNARLNNQVLVLGNVPLEDPNRVRQYLSGMWQPPARNCVYKLNDHIAEKCEISNQCYIVDLFNIVKRVNSDDPNDWIEFEGQTFHQPVLRTTDSNWNYLGDLARMLTDGINPWRADMLRGDGVHLTLNGEAYMAKAIEEEILKNPPQCQ